MKIFETHRKSIRGISLIIMAIYLFTAILSLNFSIARSLGIVMIFLASIATIMQIITCVKNLARESTCNGRNGFIQGLLLWVVIFVVTLIMF